MSNLREVDVCLKRIRELEAELAQSCSRPQVHAHLLARAEKAEARVARLGALVQRAIGFGLGGSWEHEAATLLEARELEADCAVHRKSRDDAWARAEKAEARVAELTDLLNRIFEHDGAVHLGPDLIIELRDLVPRPGFAREREAK